MKHRVVFVLGTRPEVIKLAPVIECMRSHGQFDVRLCSTGQHREMLSQALSAFGLCADVNLDLMTADQTLSGLTARAVVALDKVYESENPSLVLVQGDTTTAMSGALAGYYRRILVGHVEAGLRTDNKYSPFPEEINRRLIGSIADLHFAPTSAARSNLLREGVSDESIHVTGNTAIDALLGVVNRTVSAPLEVKTLTGQEITKRDLEGKRLILVTAHRRENHDVGLDAICEALTEAAKLPDAFIVFAVHLNPNVRAVVLPRLQHVPNVHLTEPLDYVTFSALMQKSYLILTDSGGIQEEAPALGRPVVVLRENTERQEGVAAGNARLVGVNAPAILNAVRELWNDHTIYDRMATASNPYGDGLASERIVSAIARRLGIDDSLREQSRRAVTV